MKKYFLYFTLLAVFQSCSNSTTQKNPSADDNINKVEKTLHQKVFFEGDSLWNIQERMKHYGVPGVSIAVIKDNKIEWLKSYGIMDKETNLPVNAHTLFQAASISKPVSAYAALKLVEEKKFDLNENVNTYLKSWKLPDNEFTEGKKVTLKGLLSHTAGVTVHGFLGYSPGLPVPTLLQVLDGVKPANSDPIRVDKIPGESFRYSGGGYCIMQQMMIDEEGKTFPQIMHDLVLHPLGMNNSTFDQPLKAEQLKMAATGYLPDGTVTKGKRHTYPEMAPAGLWTTAEDLAKFAIDIQKTYKGESKVVLSKEMITTMLTPVIKNYMGLGIAVMPKKEDVYFGHDGWNEGFLSKMIAHRDKGYGVVILINANQPDFIDEVLRSVATVYEWDNFVPIYKKMSLDPKEITLISGRYKQHSDGLIKIYESKGHLYKQYLGADADEIFKVTDSTYIGADNHPVQFKKNIKTGIMELYAINASRGEVEFTCVRMNENEKLPFELLEENKFDAALKLYQRLKKQNPNDKIIQEDNLNQVGYNLLSSGKIKLARDLFKINTILYPFSSNAYDSYAEACMKNNEYELATENYKLSLKLNPGNKNAEKMIEEIKKKKGV